MLSLVGRIVVLFAFFALVSPAPPAAWAAEAGAKTEEHAESTRHDAAGHDAAGHDEAGLPPLLSSTSVRRFATWRSS